MTQPDAARVERGPITEVERFTLGMAALLERQGFTVAANELRRLHAENEHLKRTLAASCDEEREQLWEAGPGGGCSRALSAEAQRDALLEALKEIAADYADRFDLDDPSTNPGIKFTIKQARAAIKQAEGENT